MNIPYELSKVRDSFSKVKTDMKYLSDKIHQNYDEFLKSHREISHKIEELSSQLSSHIASAHEHHKKGLDDKQAHDLKLEVKELKKELQTLEKDHSNLTHKLEEEVSHKKDSKELKEVKERVHSSELEIYLLKERLMEKDMEMKQLKDVNQRLFDIVDELAKLEQNIVSK